VRPAPVGAVLAGLLAGLLASAAACRGDSGDAVVLHGRDGSTVRVAVEIAATPRAREIGLMYRDALATDSGMLFVFPKKSPQSFWMRNTRIPLDIVYLDDDGRIVRIHRKTEPFTDTPRPSGAPVRFVLEVDGGYMEQHGVGEGDRVELGRLKDTPAR
jgi:uncharacterized membrane protein (UPF0127 family)